VDASAGMGEITVPASRLDSATSVRTTETPVTSAFREGVDEEAVLLSFEHEALLSVLVPVFVQPRATVSALFSSLLRLWKPKRRLSQLTQILLRARACKRTAAFCC
jgi:hypothetical protein